jgi:hypothetical protein
VLLASACAREEHLDRAIRALPSNSRHPRKGGGPKHVSIDHKLLACVPACAGMREGKAPLHDIEI